MEKTTRNAHLVTTELKRVFFSPQICWLRKIRSVESFGQWGVGGRDSCPPVWKIQGKLCFQSNVAALF